MNDRKTTRRAFVGALGAGALLASGARLASGYPANESIRIGCIGTGGRMRRALMPSVKQVEGTEIVAVCDIWERHLEEAKKLASKAEGTKDYRAVLERKDVDAVVIATPDHLHVPFTVAACEAGKDVYVEKPLTHDLSEGKAVIEAQNLHRRIVQVGMQQRSMPHIQRAFERYKEGRIGTVHKVHLTWNRNTDVDRRRPLGIRPESVDWKAFLGSTRSQPFDEYRFRNWRWFWDFGGGILTDLMVHYIDVVNWFLNLDHPETAATIGDHFRPGGVWETPDTIQTLLHYPKQRVQIYFEGTFVNARNRAMIELMGSDGTLYIDRGRYEIHPERGRTEYEEHVLGEGGRGSDFYKKVNGGLMHIQNWIDCVRSRQKTVAPAEAGVAACTGAHLGNIAYREGKVARWKE